MAIEPTELLIGIDFGTSTSVICCMRYQNGEPLGDLSSIKNVVFGSNSPTTPTLIQRAGDASYYGPEAAVAHRRRGQTETLYSNFKIQLESPDPEEREQARQLTQEFFQFLHKKYADQHTYLGEESDLERTLVSYPVKWSQETKDFLCQTAVQAGFPNVEGIDEAQAAIHAVLTLHRTELQNSGLFQNRQPALVLLVDMGAGTTDLVLCRCPSPNQTQVICTWPQEGSTFFGGREVDEQLRQYLLSKLPPEEVELMQKRCDLQKFKSWKEQTVSGNLQRNEPVDIFDDWDRILELLQIETDYTFDRKTFEKFMADYLRQFPQLVRGCLQAGNVRPEDLDLVVLTGGHSQWYFVEELLLDQLPLNGSAPLGLTKIKNDLSRIRSISLPQETVARGLAYMGLRKEEPEPTPKPAPQPEPKVEGDTVSPSPEESTDQNADSPNMSELYYQAECGDVNAQFRLGVCYENGTGVNQNFDEAVKWYRAAAEQGYAAAQCNLGSDYYNGTGVTQNFDEAVRWFRKAAEQGYADAQFRLGVCYENGTGVTQDLVEAVRWYRAAAEQGLSTAQCNLGICYEYGTGVAKDPVEAVRWYRAAAEQGHAQAQFNLGVCYKYGTGVAKNLVEAVKWYRKAAEQGYADAQCNLGVCYEFGTGVAKNLVEAVKLFRAAAEQGNAQAQCNLGICYKFGTGVAKNLVEAVKLYRAAAEQGHAQAQCNLGLCYIYGTGVAKDPVEAVKWYHKAAEQGYADAQCNLGVCYECGTGVAKDPVEAVKLYRAAAEQGLATAQCNLGVCYENGTGVAKNLVEAVKWYRAATEQEYARAQYELGMCYIKGNGVEKDAQKGQEWCNKAIANGYKPPLLRRLFHF